MFLSAKTNRQHFYLDLKTNYTSDGKYLAVITKNGLWIKDVIDDKILIINSVKIDQNYLIDDDPHPLSLLRGEHFLCDNTTRAFCAEGAEIVHFQKLKTEIALGKCKFFM